MIGLLTATLLAALLGLQDAATAFGELVQLTNKARTLTRDMSGDDPRIGETIEGLVRAHQRFLQQWPEHVPAWTALARLQAQAGDFDAADAAFDTAVRLEPDNTGARVNWIAMWVAHEPGRAFALADRLIEADPSNLVLHTNRIRAMDTHDPAGLDLRIEALIAHPGGTVEVAALADAMSRQDLDRARTIMDRATEALPPHPALTVVQARLDRMQNHFGRARQAMETLPASILADPATAYLYSDTCYANHDFQDAIRLLDAIDHDALEQTSPGLARRLRILVPLRRQLAEEWADEQQQRLRNARADLPLVMIVVDGQEVICELHSDAAPNTVAAFLAMADAGFHDDRPVTWSDTGFRTIFGERTPGMAFGDAPWTLAGEFEREQQRPHTSGVLTMLRSARDPDSADTRFTISHFPTPHLDGVRTQFGRVISGLDVIRELTGDEHVQDVRVLRRGAPMQPPTVLDQNKVPVELRELEPGAAGH